MVENPHAASLHVPLPNENGMRDYVKTLAATEFATLEKESDVPLEALGTRLTGLSRVGARTAIALALVGGYPATGSFVAARLVSLVAVLGMLYLIMILCKELFGERLEFDSPRSLAIAADFGVSTRWLGLAAVLTGAGIGLALSLAAMVLYIGPW